MKFPIFAVNCSCSPLSTSRMREKRRKTKKNEKKRKSEEKRKKRKKWENSSDPIYTNPIKNFPIRTLLRSVLLHDPLVCAPYCPPLCLETRKGGYRKGGLQPRACAERLTLLLGYRGTKTPVLLFLDVFVSLVFFLTGLSLDFWGVFLLLFQGFQALGG